MTGSDAIVKLTSIEENFTVSITMKNEATTGSSKDMCIIDQFTYIQTTGDKKATWTREAMDFTDSTDASFSTKTTAGGWVVVPKGDTISLAK